MTIRMEFCEVDNRSGIVSGIVDLPMRRASAPYGVSIEPSGEAVAVAAAAEVRAVFARRAGARACGCPPEGLLVRRPHEPATVLPALGSVPPGEWWRGTIDYYREVARCQFLNTTYGIHWSWWETHD